MAMRKKAAKKVAARKAPAKKAAARKAPARKAPARKAPAKKAPAKKASTRKGPRQEGSREGGRGPRPMGPSASARGVTVGSYVASLRDWRGEVVSAVRRLILEAVPEAVESFKWGQPVYEAHGPFAHIKAYASHVNFGFWRGAELTDPKGLLKGSGSRMRHVELRSPADIDTSTLQAMVRTAVELNRVKGNPAQRR